MNKRTKLVGLAAGLATVTGLTVATLPSATASITENHTCTDGGGHLWTGHVTWGGTANATNADGTVTINPAGFKTSATDTDGVDGSIKTYGAGGVLVQTLSFTDQKFVGTVGNPDWLNYNVTDPVSGAGAKVVMNLGDDNDGFGNCDITFLQPTSTYPTASTPTPTPTVTPTSTPTSTPTNPPTTPPALPASATAKVETDAFTGPFPGYPDNDVADDSAVYPNGADSVVIGGNKAESGVGGIYTTDLSGNRIQFLTGHQIGNVDLRTGFTLGTNTNAILVAANSRDDNTARFWTLNPTTKQLTAVGSIPTGANYGGCLYKSVDSGNNNFYWMNLASDGTFKQFKLTGTSGSVTSTATPSRTFDVGGISEACVADDANGKLYIGEEDVAIWKYGAHSADGSTRTQVDPVTDPSIAADIEGMDMVEGATNSDGYLIVSSQGESKYSVYERGGTNAFVRQFNVVGSGTVDAATDTDGLSVGQGNLGADFPQGVLVVHDNNNTGSKTGSSNLKFVPLEQAVKLS